MPTILGIESTAHTFGIGVVKDGKILSNVKKTYTTETGGIIPIEAAKFHFNNKNEIYFEALTNAKIKEEDIDAIAFSNAPGLAPCLIEGMKFAKELSLKLKIPLIPVNHCVAHLEIGRTTGAKDPVMLYCSGANTQIIAYGSENSKNKFSDTHQKCKKHASACNTKSISETSGKYRIFGETLDIGVGNFIDTFARYAGIGFPGGPKIAELAESKNCKYIELPYSVKGMDVAFSGILTKLRQMLEKMDLNKSTHKFASLNSSQINNELLTKSSNIKIVDDRLINNRLYTNKFKRRIQAKQNSEQHQSNYTLVDLSYSLQETVFAMLVETAERALAHTGKKELLLGGGVACNKRFQEMCRIMCKERKAKLFVPENSLLVDNGAMIAYLGEIMFKKGIFEKDINKIDIKPRQRTDEVEVSWR